MSSHLSPPKITNGSRAENTPSPSISPHSLHSKNIHNPSISPTPTTPNAFHISSSFSDPPRFSLRAKDKPLMTRHRAPWKKLLYLHQSYPDNYTSASFLSQLKRNTTVIKHSYWKLVDDFALIAQHLSSIMAVIVLFVGIHSQNINPIRPTVYTTIITSVAYMATNQHSSKSLKSSLVLLFIILILSPVLKSLTKSTSSDSIWAISSCLCLANTLFHEYALASHVADCKPIISTNISLANAVVLASRLSSNISVFCFVLFSIQVNILLPLFDLNLRHYYPMNYHRTLFISSSVVIATMIGRILGLKLLLIWISFQISLVFILPAYFIFLQRYKNELQGPWDPAIPIT
ncbi:phosphatidylinositol N-acetylglucosaminyltransferase Gpi2p subunit [[Candida] anglica]|uniref:Phosphatidylinositol N-acetylglucosaminyltransferase Gpi2p subunit n=1 Tax=[Candida] anglica TaxID=148631 RepID=A0ABP0ELM3_9ASCO